MENIYNFAICCFCRETTLTYIKNVKAANSLFCYKSVDLVQDIYGDISARNLPTGGRKSRELEQI
jgi:hypothetical protein